MVAELSLLRLRCRARTLTTGTSRFRLRPQTCRQVVTPLTFHQQDVHVLDIQTAALPPCFLLHEFSRSSRNCKYSSEVLHRCLHVFDGRRGRRSKIFLVDVRPTFETQQSVPVACGCVFVQILFVSKVRSSCIGCPSLYLAVTSFLDENRVVCVP